MGNKSNEITRDLANDERELGVPKVVRLCHNGHKEAHFNKEALPRKRAKFDCSNSACSRTRQGDDDRMESHVSQLLPRARCGQEVGLVLDMRDGEPLRSAAAAEPREAAVRHA